MIPIPPLRAMAIAFNGIKLSLSFHRTSALQTISASVTVSMFEETMGLLSVIFRDRRVFILTPRRDLTGERLSVKRLVTSLSDYLAVNGKPTFGTNKTSSYVMASGISRVVPFPIVFSVLNPSGVE